MTVEDAAKKYSWIKIGEDGVPELFADNHMLSSLRTCEAYFTESILNSLGSSKKSWSLEFGCWFHRCMEYFDSYESKGWKDCPDFAGWMAACKHDWLVTFDLEQFKELKQYKTIGGWNGAMLLLMQYWNTYGQGKERLRTVGTELGFGKLREVPIQKNPDSTNPFKCYLTGRIDRLVDNGTTIGPLDRKTTSYFDGTEGSDFKPHDGMQGYVYAAQKLVNRITNGEAEKLGRLCNAIIIDHVSLRSTPNEHDRFKRSIKFYTPGEMEAYRLRMLSTFHKLYEIVILEREPDWNTSMCSMFYYRDCPYKQLHELPAEQRVSLMGSFYTQIEKWNPYENPVEAK